MKGERLFKDSMMNGPFFVNTTKEKLPSDLTGSLTFDYKTYYFFRGHQYCKRPLKISKFSIQVSQREERFQVDQQGNQKLISRTEARLLINTMLIFNN